MKIYKYILILALFVACGNNSDDPLEPENGNGNVKPKPIEVISINLNISKITLYKGEELSLVATVFPANASDKNLI